MILDFDDDFELLETQSGRRIFGMTPEVPYLYLILRRISTGKVYHINFGCPVCEEIPKVEEIKQKILEKIKEVRASGESNVSVLRRPSPVN